MTSKKKKLDKIDKEKVVKPKKKEEKKKEPEKTTPKKKTKLTGPRKVQLKPSFRDMLIFIGISLVLGLIFMNIIFTLLLIFGVLFIVLCASIFGKLKRKWIKVIITIFVILFLIACIGAIGGAVWFVDYVVKNAPEFTEDAFNMSQTSIVYAANGTKIAELGTEKRELIKYDQMNEVIVDSLIATEDSRFFQHNGFDAPRFLIASVKQAAGNSDAGGASTLSMQVAKTHYQQEKATVTKGFEGIVRKFTDIYMAVFKIEKNYSKQEIIEFYLNDHFLGNNSYGVEQAAHTYFSKKAKDLNLAEASLIIGLYQAPGAYNPFVYPEKAEARRAEVLYLLERHGYITHEEREIANSIPVSSLLKPQTSEAAYYSYLVTVIEEAKSKFGVNPNTTSCLIYTNMDVDHQQVMDDALAGRTFAWPNPDAQAGLSVVDIHTGKVVAIAAGRNQDGGLNFNYATMTKRQIGSSAKPIFAYGPGIEYNNWSTYKLFDDSKYHYSSGQEIHDADRRYMGIMTLRNALAQSRNIPALKAFQQVDNNKIFEFATSLGISLEEEAKKTGFLHEAYSIGSFNGSNPWQMAAAYAAFANGGTYYEPYTINKIVFRDTNEVITYESDGKRVMSDATAFMITDVLKSAVTTGVSGAAKVPGVNVAAKTGTTNLTSSIIYKYGYRSDAVNDAWVVGYDPEYAIAMWYGYEPLSKTYYTTNNTAYGVRAGLWTATAGRIFKRNGADFSMPSSVVKVGIEKSSNVDEEPKLAGPYTPEGMTVYEYFKKGTEPTEISTRYMRLGTPQNFGISYEPSKKRLNFSWDRVYSGVEMSEDVGELGYNLYKNGEFIAFTTSNAYSIENVSDPNGRYAVRATFKNSDTNISDENARNFEYHDMTQYNSQLLAGTSKTYNVGDALQAEDANPSKSDVKVTKSGADVTGSATVNISIKNSKNENVGNITTSDADTYTITYSIKYEVYTKTYSRTITVKSTPQPDPNTGDLEPEENS